MSSPSAPVAEAAPPRKPLPVPSELARPFWDALGRGELRLQRCDGCGHFNHPPRIACPACHGRRFTWTQVEPRGTLYSYTIVHRPPVPAFKADVPYAVALVDIAGTNARLLSNLRAPLASLRVGMPVQVAFEPADGEITLFSFKPAAAARTGEGR